MPKFLAIFIFIVGLISPIGAEKVEFCKWDNFFKICGESGVITSIISWESVPLILYLSDFSEIAPYTFQNMSLPSLQFDSTRFGLFLSIVRRRNCNRKFIKLTPTSFAGLSVDNLELECMAIATEPNPFKKLASLTSLQLEKVEIRGNLQNFLADFRHLNNLTLIDLNITTISPNLLSPINQKLTRLQVIDKIRIIEAKSFEKFHKLKTLELHGGELTEVPADMFDGLDRLKNLDLADNRIKVLRNHAFSQLAELKTLILCNNNIRRIEPEAFEGLNLRQLNLSNNTVKILPIGVFHNLKNMEMLSLTMNKIAIVHCHFFEGLTKLRKLYLNYNEIYQIHENAFQGLHLNQLNLGHNNLTLLEANIFSGLYVDSLLNIRYNKIHEIQPQAFGNLTAGKVVICHNNLDKVYRESWTVKDPTARILIEDCSERQPTVSSRYLGKYLRISNR